MGPYFESRCHEKREISIEKTQIKNNLSYASKIIGRLIQNLLRVRIKKPFTVGDHLLEILISTKQKQKQF